MAPQEITGVVIDSDHVTNDPAEIEAALLLHRPVRYVSRDCACLLAQSTQRAEWSSIAEAPALYVIVDGVRYRRHMASNSISFDMSPPASSAAVC